MFLLIVIILYFAIGWPIKKPGRVERELIASGGIDTWADYREFMSRRLKAMRLVLRIMLVFVPLGAFIVYLFAGIDAGFEAGFGAVFLMAFPAAIYARIVFGRAKEEAIQRGLLIRRGRTPNVRRPVAAPTAGAEHGSARYAEDVELHAKGYAERE